MLRNLTIYPTDFTHFFCIHLFLILSFGLWSPCAVVILRALFASNSFFSFLMSRLTVVEDGSSSSVSDSHFCK